MAEPMRTYKMTAFCGNCGFETRVSLPFGRLAPHDAERLCAYCGVKCLHRYEKLGAPTEDKGDLLG